MPFLFTSLRIVDGEPGIRGWALSGIDPAIHDIDGLPTTVVDASPPAIAQHANGAVELDHVVVLTGSLERTCGAIADATGAPLKRVRDLGDARQGFHRIGRGGLIVEVVERPEVGDDPASFWGVVINVSDLDAAIDALAGPEPRRAGEGRRPTGTSDRDRAQRGRSRPSGRDDVLAGTPVDCTAGCRRGVSCLARRSLGWSVLPLH